MRRVLVCLVLLAAAADAHRIPHGDARRIDDALDRIRQSVDPCGESAEIVRLLNRLERCAGYEIRTSSTAERNLFDRGIITWNPDLRSELEPACEEDTARPVLRDPTASLLHE